MKFRLILKVSKSRIRRFSSQRSSFGIAFDIDGVILRGKSLIGGSSHALKRLYNHDGSLRVPFLFLTNGGGIPESKRASELSGLLDVNISPLQVVQGHSPFRELVTRYKDELVVAIGKGEPASVMSEYGFRKVLSIDEYASYFQDIDPLSQYKNWTVKQVNSKNSTDYSHNKYDVLSERVKGAFVVSDPIDWGRDIQGGHAQSNEDTYNSVHTVILLWWTYMKPATHNSIIKAHSVINNVQCPFSDANRNTT